MKKLLIFLILAALMLPSGLAEEPDDGFIVGYGERAVTADPDADGVHYVAGYNNDMTASDVLDDQYAKAVYIEASDGSHVMLLSVDCVALARSETLYIRSELAKHGIDNVHIISTHDHAGSDTLGLWGKVGQDGKNDAFMERLRAAAIGAASEAFAAGERGSILFGQINTESSMLQEDTRLPRVFDSNLYTFRFVPDDPDGQGIRIVNYAAHAESLDGSNRSISADFPAVVAEILAETDGTKTVWIPGAIGGLIRTRFMRTDRRTNCRQTGEKIAELILNIQDETVLPSVLRLDTVEFSVPCENPLFIAMRALGVLDSVSHGTLTGTYIDTEMSLLQLGGKRILLIPGEIFPELVYGNDTLFVPNYPEKAIEPLAGLFGGELLVFGLADDEIGYIVSPDNFMLNEQNPYLSRTKDRIGEDHYEETNSLGPETALYIREASEKLAAAAG